MDGSEWVSISNIVEPPVVPYRNPRTGDVGYGHATHTCFVVDGVAGAIGMRVGAPITDAWSRFMPLAL